MYVTLPVWRQDTCLLMAWFIAGRKVTECFSKKKSKNLEKGILESFRSQTPGSFCDCEILTLCGNPNLPTWLE